MLFEKKRLRALFIFMLAWVMLLEPPTYALGSVDESYNYDGMAEELVEAVDIGFERVDEVIPLQELPPVNFEGISNEEEIDSILKKLAMQELELQKTSKGLTYNYSKSEIEQLLLNGVSPDDIYLSYFLANELQVEPEQILQEKQKSELTWEQMEEAATQQNSSEKSLFEVESNLEKVELSEEVLTDITDEALTDITDETLTDITDETLTETVVEDGTLPEELPIEIEVPEIITEEMLDEIVMDENSALNMLVSNVNSVINGLITQQMINQTNKPQYADREGNSEFIDPVTGKLVVKQLHISLPGRDGLDLNIGTMYDSNQSFHFVQNIGSPWELKKNNYWLTRYDLGAGWSFQFPSVQKSEGYLFYHNGQGAVYTVEMNSSDSLVNYTHLVGYQGKDLRFMDDLQGQFSNGTENSRYYLEYADKKREYFASDGRLLGIQDRFGNRITFNHIDRITYDGQTNKVISAITDSIGRVVRFDYETTLQNPSAFSGEAISVRVYNNSNDTITRQEIEFQKTRVASNYNGVLDGKYLPILHDYKNQLGEYTYYNHEFFLSNFHPIYKTHTSYSGNNYGLYLTHINSPSSYVYYEYEKVGRNWTSSGFTEEYRAKKRYNTLKTSGAAQGEYQRVDYTYNGDYTGYPTYSNSASLPQSYNYSSKATTVSSTAINGLATTYLYNGEGKPISTETKAANGEKKLLRNLSFDSTFKYLPTLVQQEIYAAGDTASAAEVLQQKNVYTPWGGLASETDFVPVAEVNNPVHAISYVYEPTYNFLQTKSWYQGANAGPFTDTYTYYSNGRLKSYKNAVSETTNYCYYTINTSQQELNNCTNSSQQLSGPVTKVIETKSLGNSKSTRNETIFKSETQYAYPGEISSRITTRNANGQSIEQIVKKHMQYDISSGRLLSEKDGDNNETVYTYDLLGRVKTVKFPQFTNLEGTKYEAVDEYSYINSAVPSTAFADIKSIYSLRVDYKRKYTNKTTNASPIYLSNKSSHYDGLGGLLYEVTSGSGSTQIQQFKYNDQRALTLSLDPMGNSISAAYSVWGELAETIDPFGNLSVTEAKLKERKQVHYFVAAADISAYRANPSSNNLKSNYVEQSYDIKGRLISNKAYPNWPSQSSPIIESYQYDNLGNLTHYTDPNTNFSLPGSVTNQYKYDGLNRVVSIIDALDQHTEYQYDPNGQLKQATIRKGSSGPQQTIFKKDYTESGGLATKTDPAGRLDQYGYNQIGLQVSRKDRNNTLFSTQYDEGYRDVIKSASATNGQSLQTRLTVGSGSILKDKIEMLQNGVVSSTITNTMDNLKRVTNVSSVSSGFSAFTGMSYDNNNNLMVLSSGSTSSSSSSSLFSTRYKYDRTRLEMVQTNGQQTINDSDVANVKYSYFPNGQLRSITYPHLTDSSILRTDYTYNALGRMTKIENKKGSTVLSSTTYLYDSNGNTTSSTQEMQGQPTEANLYSYDRLNRLIGITRSDGSQATYTYDLKGNRLTTQDSRGMIFDVSDQSFTYDLYNTLKQVIKSNNTTNFEYGPDGLRYKKTNGSNVTQYRYNTNKEVIAEVNANNQAIAHYVRGDRLLVKKEVATSKDYYYLYNGHGDVIQIIDTSGSIVNKYRYDEWGNVLQRDEGIENSFLYAGQQYDKETGLYYLRARYYDPAVGRFLNEDTYEGQITNPLSMNLYTYVENNPINWIDPSGHAKASDNAHLTGLVQGYTDKWNRAQQNINTINHTVKTCSTVTLCQNAQTMLPLIDYYKGLQKEYEMGADAVRTSYYKLHGMAIPSDVKYRSSSITAPNVTVQLNSLMSEFNTDFKDNTENSVTKLRTFVNNVKTGGRVDVKNSHFKDNSYYIYSGELYRRDDLGNIYFGYAGKVFGYDDTFLKSGAGIYQIYSGTSEWGYVSSYFDDPRDSAMIQVGIDIYNSIYK
ncbi:hypothetical protein PA598K_02671 [Paenibacillus sp. 598K]|uniref:RHS repeat-associated core domain-containing protein n=1 Tax=Paenibacillus sp. 598K TaxID=1117987 RepID=UPI000FFAA6FF|nr:RHS repeat-associated core domain-containing protein [Paenibacillus sp. 598K]GBF74333.1 hypothetical protein PA598K_02671 [Paenibacillus sp. 598K]